MIIIVSVTQIVVTDEMKNMPEESLLIKAFGNSPKMRIIDFFLDNKIFDFSKKEIMEEIGMSKVTFYKYWDEIERVGIVKVSRRFGKTKLYELDKKNIIVEKLIELENILIEKSIQKIEKRLAIRTAIPLGIGKTKN